MTSHTALHKHHGSTATETPDAVPGMVELPVNPDEATPLLPDDDGVVQVPT